ncbi:MAG: nitrate/nitrite transport system substrate-binding protein [Actinomycetota bacterium]|jgi:nitrate/nitrite transport system substrate-binding protein|nr:nitrate/nitrite transport system substrate-binding protein [Actinomycetota bacterium]
MDTPIDRRRFLAGVGAGLLLPTVGSLLAACGPGTTGAKTAAAKSSSSGPPRKVKLGFIALTDCASIVMAKELGYFAERGLDVEVLKQASWPATRDNLLNGQIDAAHCLFSMPFSLATGIGGTGTALKIAMVLNNNGQAITLNKDFASVGYGDLEAAKAALESKSPTLAMTFPGGTHDAWLRYWLKATGANTADVKVIPVPPPQMVANMTVGNMDGYCVGEPWNAVAVAQGIGFTHLATQDLWQHHPEKALVVNEQFAADKEHALSDVMGAVLKASKWLDVPANRSQAATTIGGAAYVNAPPDDIRGRLLGKYDLGANLPPKTFTGDQMTFFRDGKVNAPRRSHAYWFMAQYQRLGLLKEAPPYASFADQIILRDLYEKVAAAEGVDVPDDDMTPFAVKLDGVTFDPKKVVEEAKRA